MYIFSRFITREISTSRRPAGKRVEQFVPSSIGKPNLRDERACNATDICGYRTDCVCDVDIVAPANNRSPLVLLRRGKIERMLRVIDRGAPIEPNER